MIKDIINHVIKAVPDTQEATRSPLIYCWNRRQGPNQGAIRAEQGRQAQIQEFLDRIDTHRSAAVFPN